MTGLVNVPKVFLREVTNQAMNLRAKRLPDEIEPPSKAHLIYQSP